MNNFLSKIPTAPLLFARSYARWNENGRETYPNVVDRCVKGLVELGKLTISEAALIREQMESGNVFPSGRWLWCGGTEWASKPQNYYGTYNCSSTEVDSIEAFGHLMNLAMMGCGTGANLEPRNIEQLPIIQNRLEISVVGEFGSMFTPNINTRTYSSTLRGEFEIAVGDSRKGWVDSYQELLWIATNPDLPRKIHVNVDLSSVRPAGAKLKGFGGTANPVKLRELYTKVANILNGAIGRKPNALECCLLADIPASVIVAGNIRRSAGIRQFSEFEPNHKIGLWKQDDAGNWYMPHPERDSLRMSNHTRVFHQKPTLQECIDSVRLQYHSGEGAIQWAGEAVARANADILKDINKYDFLQEYDRDIESARDYLESESGGLIAVDELNHRMNRFGLNPCFADGTMVLTREGHYTIESLVGKTVEIWDGLDWVEVNNFQVTGQSKEVLRVTLSSGDSIVATPYHDFILADGARMELRDLHIGDRLKVHNQHPEKAQKVSRSIAQISITNIEDAGIADLVYCCNVPTNNRFALSCGIIVGNCGEILGTNFECNLSDVHLNQLDPLDLATQYAAFEAAAINVCCLLHHEFDIERYRYSRELDPIVGVSFTGLFDFFVNLFGVDWLRWWQAGRPEYWYQGKLSRPIHDAMLLFDLADTDFKHEAVWDYALIFTAIEQEYLQRWQSIVTKTVHEYCTRHGLKVPNRCTTVQPSGSKSLLTGASPGWHPPKAQRFIRRITFAKSDPIALAAIDYGYSVIPSQSDKDEHGNLLDDAFDPRCTEWLVEIPCQVPWADLEGAEDIDISRFSALAQFDFYMQVQQFYTSHNTSATIEFRKDEIEPLATQIYKAIQEDEGYISAALLARFDDHQTFPRLPFEPIDKATYLELISGVLERRISDNFDELLARYDLGLGADGASAAGCDSDKCLMP